MKLEVTEKTQEKIRMATLCSPHCDGFDQMTKIIIYLDLGLQITKEKLLACKKLLSEIKDNCDADAINLPDDMYSEIKTALK